MNNKLFLYNNALYEQFDDLSIFFNIFYYDPKTFDFFYGEPITIDCENWYKLTLMPNNTDILANYIRVKNNGND
jgi:hypothetical protein